MIEHLAQGALHSRPTRLLPVRHIDVSPVRISYQSNTADPPVYCVQGLVHEQPDAPPDNVRRVNTERREEKSQTRT